MNYDSVKTHLEAAHSILIRTGEELDLQNLSYFASFLKAKDWRGALSALEECGAATDCDAEFWREMLVVAHELELPRFQARIEERVKLAGA